MGGNKSEGDDAQTQVLPGWAGSPAASLAGKKHPEQQRWHRGEPHIGFTIHIPAPSQ